MKTRKFLIFWLLLCIPWFLFCQQSDDEIMGRVASYNICEKRNFSIKTDILTPVVNYFFWQRPTACLSFERDFSYRHGIQITALYGTYKGHSTLPYNISEMPLSQTRAEFVLDYKYYWKDSNNFNGFYCGLYLRGVDYNSVFWTVKGALAYDQVSLWYVGYGCGAAIGYQTFIRENFTLDFLFGLGVRNIFFNPAPNYDKIHVFDQADISVPLRTLVDGDIRTTINVGYKF